MRDDGTSLWSSNWVFFKSWSSSWDTFPTDLGNANKPTKSDGLFDCNGFSAIKLRIFGQDAANEAANIKVYGWMDNLPGHVLWHGSVTLGSSSVASSTLGNYVTSGTWYEVDTWTATSNASSAESFGYADGQSILTIPTHGYKSLYIEAEQDTAAALAAFWTPQAAIIAV